MGFDFEANIDYQTYQASFETFVPGTGGAEIGGK